MAHFQMLSTFCAPVIIRSVVTRFFFVIGNTQSLGHCLKFEESNCGEFALRGNGQRMVSCDPLHTSPVIATLATRDAHRDRHRLDLEQRNTLDARLVN